VAYTCNPRQEGSVGRRIKVQGWPQAKTQDPTYKITKAKRAESVAQVVELPPSKYKTLSSAAKLPPTKKQQQKRVSVDKR
jgi:hypothetical protein